MTPKGHRRQSVRTLVPPKTTNTELQELQYLMAHAMQVICIVNLFYMLC